MIFIHHWLFHPETLLLTLNSAAVRDRAQGKEFAMPAALSPGLKFNMAQSIPNTTTTSYDFIRFQMTCESHCLIWIWLVGYSSIFGVPGGLSQSRIDRMDRIENRCHWPSFSAEHIQAHNCEAHTAGRDYRSSGWRPMENSPCSQASSSNVKLLQHPKKHMKCSHILLK